LLKKLFQYFVVVEGETVFERHDLILAQDPDLSLAGLIAQLAMSRTNENCGHIIASRVAARIGISAEDGINHQAQTCFLIELAPHRFVLAKKDGKRHVYEITNPQLIAEAFTAASHKADAGAAKVLLQKEKHFDEQVRFLEGASGIRAAFDDVIAHTPRGDTFYRYTSEKDLAQVNSYLSPDYRARRDAKKLERLVISNPVSGKQKRSRLERFIRYIPADHSLFDQNIIQIIYGDRLLFIDLDTEKVVIIENKTLAEFQKVIFRQLYNSLPSS